MKKFIFAFGGLLFIFCLIFLAHKLSLIIFPAETVYDQRLPEELKPCASFFEDPENLMIPVESAAGIEKFNTAFISPLDSLNPWERAEKFMNNRRLMKKYLNSRRVKDVQINESRQKAYDLRIQIIKMSQERYHRMQHNWGNILSAHQDGKTEVYLLEYGIAIKVKGRFHFFNRCAIRYQPQDSKEISVQKGIDGNWYPAVMQDGIYLPLTYWGEIPNRNRH